MKLPQLVTTAAAALWIACAAAPVHAQSAAIAPPQAVERLFSGGVEEDWFADSFLREVSVAQVSAIVADLQRRYGRLVGVEPAGDRLTARLERAELPVRISLDGAGRITGLLFEAPIVAGGFDDHVKAIADLPGEVALLIVSDGEVVAAHRADEPLAVGSAAKLAILAAVDGAVAAGRLGWDRVVGLDPRWRSLPTGLLQDWPAGTPLTVATLAHLAISLSDNTATDALIDLVGREAVEALTPRNAPFLTTRELFVLKARDAVGLREAWRAGTAETRRELLNGIHDRPVPRPAELVPEVTSDIEWFLSARELCALLEATAALPSLAINPGLADPADWQGIAYKGGSETGVLNLSTRLTGRDGRAHCVVATWNDETALDANRLQAPYRALLRALAAGNRPG